MKDERAKDKSIQEQYFVVHGWMRTRLGLSGTALLVYAIIYGYCHSGGEFYGTLDYLADWTGATPRTIINVLAGLTAAGYIRKRSFREGRSTRTAYTVVAIQSEKTSRSKESFTVKNLHGEPDFTVKNFPIHSEIISHNKDRDKKEKEAASDGTESAATASLAEGPERGASTERHPSEARVEDQQPTDDTLPASKDEKSPNGRTTISIDELLKTIGG